MAALLGAEVFSFPTATAQACFFLVCVGAAWLSECLFVASALCRASEPGAQLAGALRDQGARPGAQLAEKKRELDPTSISLHDKQTKTAPLTAHVADHALERQLREARTKAWQTPAGVSHVLSGLSDPSGAANASAAMQHLTIILDPARTVVWDTRSNATGISVAGSNFHAEFPAFPATGGRRMLMGATERRTHRSRSRHVVVTGQRGRMMFFDEISIYLDTILIGKNSLNRCTTNQSVQPSLIPG